jgi:hypothetical protein
MTVKRVCLAILLGAAVAACQKDTAGVLQTSPATAGLRYFHAVPDTGYMDMRLVDIFDYAPNTVGAAFRTGGNPMGVPTSLPPPFLSVRTGTHEIKAFLDSTDLTTATTVMYDTTVTFVEGHNYTLIVYGSARSGTLHSLLLDNQDQALPSDTGTNPSVWVRTVHLAGDTTKLGVPDVFVTTAASPSGTPTFGGPAYKAVTAYQRISVGALKAYLTRTGTTTPVTVTGTLPAGAVGTTTVNPIAGALVNGTYMTILILPRVTPDSISSLTNVATTVTPAPPDTAYTVDTMFATTSHPHHLLTGQKIHIYDAAPADYVGTFTVIVTGASTLKWAYPLYRGTPVTYHPPPASPATGTIVYEYWWKDLPNPGLVFLIDQQPPLTAP